MPLSTQNKQSRQQSVTRYASSPLVHQRTLFLWTRVRRCAPTGRSRLPLPGNPGPRSDIRSVVEGPPLQLLEAVAHRGADLVLRRHPRVRAVRLGVRKLCIPGLPSVVDSVGVEVVRRRHPG